MVVHWFQVDRLGHMGLAAKPGQKPRLLAHAVLQSCLERRAEEVDQVFRLCLECVSADAVSLHNHSEEAAMDCVGRHCVGRTRIDDYQTAGHH